MNKTVRKALIIYGSCFWLAILLIDVSRIHNVYQFYLRFYDQTREELAEKVSTKTDPQFAQWVETRILEHHPQYDRPIICATDNHPATGEPLFDAISYLFLINDIQQKDAGIMHMARNAERVHTLCFPLKYQTHVLQHLDQQHSCDEQCANQLGQLTAVLDHEYAHVLHQDCLTRSALFTFGAGALDCLCLPVALACLYFGAPIIFAAVPLLSRVGFVALFSYCSRQFEYRADEAIRNDTATLQSWIDWLNNTNECMVAQLQIEQNPWMHLALLSEHDNGFWARHIFGEHPPINARIARAQERLNSL